MTVDGEVAIVGSGNQDYFAWEISHEFNVLLDHPGATAQVEAAVFQPDWERAIGNYLELYEGNDAEQELVCPIAALPGVAKNVKFGDTEFCDNDEARSLILHDLEAGQVVRLYDDPDRVYRDDDWTEIIVKQDVARKVIPTFEQHIFDDDDVRVIYHSDNNDLDGQVSSIEIALEPIGTVVDLYEGYLATGDLVCSTRIDGPATYDFQDDPFCNNDSARSLELYDLPADQVVWFYDSPSGSLDDDWTAIIPKVDLPYLILPSLETDIVNDAFVVLHHEVNGLDQRVSRMRIGTPDEVVGVASFYEGNDGTQDLVCELAMVDRSENFKDHGECDNDEARSMRLSQVPAGTVIRIYNDPDCQPIDDWAMIWVIQDLDDKLIDSFEENVTDDDLVLQFFPFGGLDGKVSCIDFDLP